MADTAPLFFVLAAPSPIISPQWSPTHRLTFTEAANYEDPSDENNEPESTRYVWDLMLVPAHQITWAATNSNIFLAYTLEEWDIRLPPAWQAHRQNNQLEWRWYGLSTYQALTGIISAQSLTKQE